MNKVVVALIALALFGCAPGGNGTSTGNPLVDIRIGSFNATAVAQKTGVSAMAVNSLKFCFKRVRFKMSGETTNPDPTIDEDNIDFDLGEVTISSLGTNLQSISLPLGTYERVEFDLEDDCASNKSVQLDNANGSFSTSDRITIRFDGNFTHDGSSDILNLGIQNIISALNTVSNSLEIKNKAEGASGDF